VTGAPWQRRRPRPAAGCQAGKGGVPVGHSGKGYIDCTSQAWSVNVGQCHPTVIAAVTEQVQAFTHIEALASILCLSSCWRRS